MREVNISHVFINSPLSYLEVAPGLYIKALNSSALSAVARSIFLDESSLFVQRGKFVLFLSLKTGKCCLFYFKTKDFGSYCPASKTWRKCGRIEW